jgi:Na+-driven multidrug efflux pump
LLATAVTSFGFVIGELFPRQLAYIFTTDPELIRQSVIGLRITFISFPVIGFQMVTAYFFQSIGLAKKAVFLSLSRQVLFLLPLLFLMPTIWGIHGVWWSLPASDVIASVVSGLMLAAQHRTFIRMQKEQERTGWAATARELRNLKIISNKKIVSLVNSYIDGYVRQ